MKVSHSIILTSLLVFSLQANDSDKWQQFHSEKALEGLDSEFEDSKPAKPKVIVKEKIVYKDKPVEVEKIIYKDKPVEVEKIVEVEKVVYRDRPTKEALNTPEPKQSTQRKYNTLYVDIAVPNDPTFVSDYLTLTERAGGLDWRKVDKMMLTAPNKGPFTITVSGKIELPQEISSDRIYIKPIVGPMIKELKVDGTAWTTTELNMLNSYKKTHTLPYSVSWTSSSWRNPKDFMKNVKNTLPTMRFLVSNKPIARGEKKEFMPARIFINQH